MGRGSVGTMTEAFSDGSGRRRLGMFPLSTILFPHALLPLHVFEPRYRELVADCMAGDARFGTVLIARGSEVGGGDERMDVGTRAVITRRAALSDGRSLMMVGGETRIRVAQWLDDDPYPLALVEEWTPEIEPDDGMLARAVRCVRRARGLLSESGTTAALSPDVQFRRRPRSRKLAGLRGRTLEYDRCPSGALGQRDRGTIGPSHRAHRGGVAGPRGHVGGGLTDSTACVQPSRTGRTALRKRRGASTMG